MLKQGIRGTLCGAGAPKGVASRKVWDKYCRCPTLGTSQEWPPALLGLRFRRWGFALVGFVGFLFPTRSFGFLPIQLDQKAARLDPNPSEGVAKVLQKIPEGSANPWHTSICSRTRRILDPGFCSRLAFARARRPSFFFCRSISAK